MQVTLKKGGYSAVIDEQGAELISLSDGKHEYIWSGSAWNRHAPVLFPFVCNTLSKKYTVNGKEYSLNNHGFARDSRFTAASVAEDRAEMLLCDSADSLAVFPYHFELRVRYTLQDDHSLLTEFNVKNTDDKPLPFYVGGHPAFKVPFESEPGSSYEDHRIVYEKPETIVQHLKDGDNTVLDNADSVDVTHELFRNDVFMKEKPASSCVAIESKKTGRRITVKFDNSGVIAVWSAYKPDADFICLEPWAQTPVYDGGTEELTGMANANVIAPGKVFTFSYTIIL